MTAPTPLPWRLTASGQIIARPVDGLPTVIANLPYGEAHQTRANGLLLAAAPELLEALRRLLNDVEGSFNVFEHALRDAIGHTNYGCIQGRIEEARAVIAKARGEVVS